MIDHLQPLPMLPAFCFCSRAVWFFFFYNIHSDVEEQMFVSSCAHEYVDHAGQ